MEAIIHVDQMSTAFPIACVFDNLGGDIAEGAGDKDELLVGRVGKFFYLEGVKSGIQSHSSAEPTISNPA